MFIRNRLIRYVGMFDPSPRYIDLKRVPRVSFVSSCNPYVYNNFINFSADERKWTEWTSALMVLLD